VFSFAISCQIEKVNIYLFLANPPKAVFKYSILLVLKKKLWRDPILSNWEFFESIFLPGSDVQRVLNEDTTVWPMFVERKVCYSALFTNLVGWHASAFSNPLSDVILVQLACPLSDVMFCLHSGITNLSLYKYCVWLDGATPP
jgi:hypothetical protein